MFYPESELVLNSKNNVYHLDIGMGDLAENIILVGDQDRVELVASFLENIEFNAKHREFVSCTGYFKGEKISVLSTGIGTDNIDIAINELDAVFNIDLETRHEKPNKTKLNFIRIGTCGILQEAIPVHSFILTSHAFGLDNVAHFYETEMSKDELNLLEELKSKISLPENIKPYISASSESLLNKLNSDKTHIGITVTSSGFYGPQGRSLRLKTKTESLNESLMNFEKDGLKILNFEMESSALFALTKALGHQSTTICLGVANRARKEFSKGYKQEMLGLIEYVLHRI